MRWNIKRQNAGVHRVEFSGGSTRPDMWAMLSADWHWDNPKCRLDRLERDLQEAQRVGAMVVSAGDLFCAMQGKYDKRSSKDSIRPEHMAGSYLDKLVDTATEFLAPYRDVMGLITLGNHETAIYGRHETCLITRLVERLRMMGSQCQRGGYNGWIQFVGKSRSGSAQGQYRVYYHHGSGGDSPVTQGLLGMSRVSQYVDADAILSGHIHTRNLSMISRERLSPQGIRKVTETALVRCSTYKDEYAPLEGFHIEKGRGPRPTERPSYWMKLKMSKGKDAIEATYHDVPPEPPEEPQARVSRSDGNKAKPKKSGKSRATKKTSRKRNT